MNLPVPIRVCIVDDYRLVRQGLRSLMEDLPDLKVVGDADASERALQLIARLQPDVVLWTVGLNGLGGAQVSSRIRRAWPKIRVLLLVRQVSELEVRKARQAGAAGYITLDCTPSRLLEAIRECINKDRFISILGSDQQPDAPPFQPLTRRQTQVLRLAARGHTVGEIAARLNISVRTAERHRACIKQVLGIHDSAGLVRYAVRNGLISETAGHSSGI